ncbi:hypothetical protein DV515_00005325, partial [Chloebia gouldiae]
KGQRYSPERYSCYVTPQRRLGAAILNAGGRAAGRRPIGASLARHAAAAPGPGAGCGNGGSAALGSAGERRERRERSAGQCRGTAGAQRWAVPGNGGNGALGSAGDKFIT